jgi:hypothetical protein
MATTNQNEFSKKYPQEKAIIRIASGGKFQGPLTIKDYPQLKKSYLKDFESIEKITLQNLPQLTEVTIWNCGMKELIIEKNCPRVVKIIIRNNDLSNLNFLVNLENLEQLDIEGNPQLVEILKTYKGDWKAHQQDLRQIYHLAKENNFSELVKKFAELKYSREELKKQIAFLLDKEKFTSSKPIITKELVFNLNQEFQEKEAKINYLTSRAEELAKASKEQKEKIINSFLRLLPEKELAQKLITTHLEFTKFKKQDIDSEDYDERVEEYEEKCLALKKQLRSKLSKESVRSTMNSIQAILTDCEELVSQELELETKLNDKSKLIATQEKNTLSEEEKEIIAKNTETQQKQLAELEELKAMVRKIKLGVDNLQPETDLISKLISQLLDNSELIQQEPQILTKISNLLGIKRVFLNARQQTIIKLQATCDILEAANIGKYANREELSRALSAAGKLISGKLPLNIIEPIGDSSSILNSWKQRKFAIKNSHNFQEFLSEEESNLELFKQTYNKLLYSLANLAIEKEQESSLFSLRYRIYDIATNIWQGKTHLETGDMKDAISALQTNLLDLTDELASQENTLKKFNASQLQALVVVPQ